jgi:hypothetical protein
MEQILISVETIQQRNKVVEVLEDAACVEAGRSARLDFPLDIWKLHRQIDRDTLHPDVTA